MAGLAVHSDSPNIGPRFRVETVDYFRYEAKTGRNGGIMSKQCQSCGMPLQTKKAGDCRGTEADGSRSEKWCSLCYADGKFLTPNCTVTEMQEIVDKALIENGSGKLMRFLAKKQIPTLERWKA